MTKRAWNFKDLTGQRFGKLLVIKDTGKNYVSEKGRVCPIFLCRCDCGEEKEISSNSLRAGSRSCNCSKDGQGRPRGELNQYSSLMGRYKYEAKTRGYCFELTKEQFFNFVTSSCFYCGAKDTCGWKEYGQIFKYNGIDRVDNDVGYVFDNCVTCCKPCNTKKKATNKNMIVKAYEFLKSKGQI